MTSEIFAAIGLMSGTSADGIDAALVEIEPAPEGQLSVTLLCGHTYPYTPALRAEILAVCAGEARSLAEICALDDAIAAAFAEAALFTIAETRRQPRLIASHGQTLFHRPPQGNTLGYSLQLGRGAAIAQLTGIVTISNFRAADIAAGGHGAPLVPLVDWLLLRSDRRDRCVQNLGGIANTTYLPAGGARETTLGWDNGPGNVLLDLAAQALFHRPYDPNGQLAAQGTACLPLVEAWLQHPYFAAPPPKSTGRELFGPNFLAQCRADADDRQLSPHDLMASLVELTARAIAWDYQRFLPCPPDEVLLCGGGTRNQTLCQRLGTLLAPATVDATTAWGVNADFKEAIAFAVLGYQRWMGQPGNLPGVTGARCDVLLGDIFYPWGERKRENPARTP